MSMYASSTEYNSEMITTSVYNYRKYSDSPFFSSGFFVFAAVNKCVHPYFAGCPTLFSPLLRSFSLSTLYLFHTPYLTQDNG